MNTFIIENGVLKKYRGHKRNVVIPDGVEVIARNAFENHCSITSVQIPESVRKIEAWAFSDIR